MTKNSRNKLFGYASRTLKGARSFASILRQWSDFDEVIEVNSAVISVSSSASIRVRSCKYVARIEILPAREAIRLARLGLKIAPNFNMAIAALKRLTKLLLAVLLFSKIIIHQDVRAQGLESSSFTPGEWTYAVGSGPLNLLARFNLDSSHSAQLFDFRLDYRPALIGIGGLRIALGRRSLSLRTADVEAHPVNFRPTILMMPRLSGTRFLEIHPRNKKTFDTLYIPLDPKFPLYFNPTIPPSAIKNFCFGTLSGLSLAIDPRLNIRGRWMNQAR